MTQIASAIGEVSLVVKIADLITISGQGNPRSSLDDVGAKYTAEQLRNLVTGADTLRGVLSDRTLNLKQKYRTLAKDDLNALIIYLQSLQISNSSARVSG